MGKFDGILLCTDLDGTLLRNDKTISAENIEAIEYFKQEGGFFTFVTGRMPFFISDTYHTVKPNVPIGCINGGGLFDYPKQEYIWTCTIPHTVLELVEHVDRCFPHMGIQINTFYHTYFCKENLAMEYFRKITNLPNLTCHYKEVTEPIAKIVFGTLEEMEILQLQEALLSHPLADRFDFIRSEKSLFEILPKGIGKGTAIQKLVQHLKLDSRKTIAIGDYNNDISMFHAAGVGVAVSNACKEALSAADYITVSNEEHAIAKLIYDLHDGKITI